MNMTCICDHNPATMDGPNIECPVHGMAEIECPHFGRPLDFPGECTICSGREQRERKQYEELMRTPAGAWITARLGGRCEICGGEIVVDSDAIVRNKLDHYVHRDCCITG